jgi:hypothetical protein
MFILIGVYRVRALQWIAVVGIMAMTDIALELLQ